MGLGPSPRSCRSRALVKHRFTTVTLWQPQSMGCFSFLSFLLLPLLPTFVILFFYLSWTRGKDGGGWRGNSEGLGCFSFLFFFSLPSILSLFFPIIFPEPEERTAGFGAKIRRAWAVFSFLSFFFPYFRYSSFYLLLHKHNDTHNTTQRQHHPFSRDIYI